ncbi:MAG TPA: serine--tRNA ligase [Bacillota bacterium]|nr:serine--tRNA ligase [Bacillota bacterium]
MLDLAFIRANPQLIGEAARQKGVALDLERLLALDAERRGLLVRIEGMRAERNRRSQEIPGLKGDERAQAIRELRGLGAELDSLEPALERVASELEDLLLRVPSPPHADVPPGFDETANRLVRRWGDPPAYDFAPADHLTLGERLGIIDVPRGVRLSGSRQYVLRGDGMLLERAILNFALDSLLRKGFTPLSVPMLIRPEAMRGTGYFPGGEEQCYAIPRDDLFLIGTAEVPVTAYHAGEILDAGDLPLRYAGFSGCFRREAGAAGRDTAGVYRVHQFYKVEQVVITRADPGDSERELELITANAEELLQALELPYRVVVVCAGEMGLGQVKKYDVETWMPSRNAYSETHSASMFHDFQARRLRIRYREAGGEVYHCHTLNNTAAASPRILIPLLEVHQQADGSVRIPPPLRPYMDGRASIGP